MELKTYFAQDTEGNVLPGAQVTVYSPAGQTVTLATLFDAAGASLSNPFDADDDGLIQFAAANGSYDVRIQSGVRDFTIPDLQLLDKSDLQASDIEYTPAGTGAVGTTVQAQQRKNIDFTNYLTPEDAVVAGKGGTINLTQEVRLVSGLQIDRECIAGQGVDSILKADTGATTVINCGAISTPSQWSPRKISNLTIDGDNKNSDGITFDTSAVSPELAGRWTLENLSITQCDKAIYKPRGNIGNRVYNVSVSNSNFGLYSVGQTSPLMHGGADVFYGGEMNSCQKAAIYIDSPQAGTGGSAFRDVILEGNLGFAVFVKNWADSFTPLIFDNLWLEVNAQVATVVINGVTYNTVEMHLENTALAIIKNGMMPKSIRLINSRLSINDSVINDGPAVLYDIDATSTVVAERLMIDGGVHPFEIRTLLGARRASGNNAQLHYAPVRTLRNGVKACLLQSLPYDGAGPFLFTGSVSLNGTSVSDGRIFSTCCNLVIPAGETLVQPAVTITSGKWYVWTMDCKLQSGTTSGLTFGIASGITLAANIGSLVSLDWKTIASVSKSGATGTVGMFINNSTGADVTLRISAWQIMEFDSEQDAIEYYNDGSYYK